MIPRNVLATVAALGLGACTAIHAADVPSNAASFMPAILAAAPAPRLAPAAAMVAPPPHRMRIPRERRRSSDRAAPVARVTAANRAAAREPARDSYLNAVQVYAWSEGALYRLYTAPEQVSDIALEARETLVSVAAGDTARWVIGDTTSGAGAARRTHILVKPTAAGLSTNLFITTDRRVYHVELESTARTAMASISWTYPEGSLLALGELAAIDQPVAAGVSLDSLNFGYSIEGDNPPWRPLRAFDDGRQVFIEFPAGLAQGEAPPLFVAGEGGRTALVNYRVRGRFYVVDRLFAAAELRLGERRQQIVRIVRGAAAKRRGGRAS